MNRALLRRSGLFAVGMLLSWTCVPTELRRCLAPLGQLLRVLGVTLFLLVAPLLFWVAPVVAWHDLRHERRRAAAAEADL